MDFSLKNQIAYGYYGQTYKYTNEWGTYSEVIGNYHTNNHIGHETFRLILKPLTAITLVDAKKVAEILNTRGDSFQDHNIQETIIEAMTTESDWANQIKFLSAYQYLQSKGYDLPHYLLGGKTLEESGLAIYLKK